MCAHVLCVCLVTHSCLTPRDPMHCSLPGSSGHGDSPGKNIGMGCHAVLGRIFPTPGLNPGLRHYKRILYSLSHQGSPWVLEWVAYPFSRGSSWPRNWSRVSCIAGGFFTSWVTKEAIHTYIHTHAHTHKTIDLLYIWNSHNIVNQLCFNINFLKKATQQQADRVAGV